MKIISFLANCCCQAQENLSFYTSQIAASHRHDSASLKNGKRVE
jgi:hypothetical protein